MKMMVHLYFIRFKVIEKIINFLFASFERIFQNKKNQSNLKLLNYLESDFKRKSLM